MNLTHSRLPPPWGANDLQAGQYSELGVESLELNGKEIIASRTRLCDSQWVQPALCARVGFTVKVVAVFD
jgi:hypothetical protein